MRISGAARSVALQLAPCLDSLPRPPNDLEPLARLARPAPPSPPPAPPPRAPRRPRASPPPPARQPGLHVDQVDLDGTGKRCAAALADQVADGPQRTFGTVDGYEQLFHVGVTAVVVRGSRAAGPAIMPGARPPALTARNAASGWYR